MDWETVLVITLAGLGYFHLLYTTKRRYVTGLVKLWVQTTEMRAGGEYPLKFELYTNSCPFIVTPTIGMEIQPEGIETAIIDRVIIDNYGLLEIICTLKTASDEGEFENITQTLASSGWRKHIS